MEQARCYGCMRPRTDGRFCQKCGFEFDAPNASHQLPAGTILKDQYLVGKVLGQGGFGITYLGWDLYLSIPVAIKEYYPTGAVMRESTYGLAVTNCEGRTGSTFENNRLRFLREAQSLAQLSNVPEVVQVRNFFPENETAYIIMEYIQGKTLKDHLQEQGAMSPAQVLNLMRPVMEGLKKVHTVGLVHRDISPDNIMLLPDGRIKLLDFGAVRDMDGDNALRSTQAILKPGFAPIEQYKSRAELGPWTDIYALCGTMYYCMTGKVPKDAPERVLDECDLGWDQIPGLTTNQILALNRATALSPQKRVQNLQELMDLLDAPACTPPVHQQQKAAAEPVRISRTVPLVGNGMREPVSYTEPVQRKKDFSADYPVFTAPLIPESPPVQETASRESPKKKGALPVLGCLAALLLVLAVCFFTVHIWEDATCTTPRVCTICGKKDGAAPGHKWADATCEEPQTCKTCGDTEGKALGHKWADATCEEPQTCKTCGDTEGKALGHRWSEATCAAPKTCGACGATEGNALAHQWKDATCTKARTCNTCGTTDGMALGHKWKNATCTTAKVCTVCNEKQGQPLGHNWKAATYDTPKTCTRCNKTEGTVRGYMASVPGEWERFHKDNSNTDALVFNTPLKNCSGFTLNYEATFNSGSYVDEWKLYYRDNRGRWNLYGYFNTDTNGACITYKFSPKLNITAVAVIPAKRGSFSYTFNLWITDAYAE